MDKNLFLIPLNGLSHGRMTSRMKVGKEFFESFEKLNLFFQLFKGVVAYYIELIKTGKLPLKVFLSTKDCPDCCIKHSRYKQLAYKVASEIVRSNLKYIQNKVYAKYKKLYFKCIKNGIHHNFTDKHFKELDINYLKRINQA